MGRPGWDHCGLPCEPGRCLCQDIALLPQLPVLTAQARQFLALGTRRSVLSLACIAIGLTNPVPDRLCSRLELARQLLWSPSRAHQFNHLSSEFWRIGCVTLRHWQHLRLKWKGVYRTGSTPSVRVRTRWGLSTCLSRLSPICFPTAAPPSSVGSKLNWALGTHS